VTITAWTRVLRFDGINNFRDYGGWRAQDGARVVTGKLYRSAHLQRASEADLGRIAELGIATVTDLRHPAEQEEQPSAWIGVLPLRLIMEDDSTPFDAAMGDRKAPHVAAFMASNFSFEAMRDFLAAHYGLMPYDVRHVAMFRRYFDALAQDDGAMLIHCAAGKDRTGILAALTHQVLGVHPDDALEDYLLSNTAGNVGERLPALKKRMELNYGREISDEAMYALLTVEPLYLERCREALQEKSGSVDRYLADVLQVDAAKRRTIQDKLLS
jgi:protein tyrosine/serine phosphatase